LPPTQFLLVAAFQATDGPWRCGSTCPAGTATRTHPHTASAGTRHCFGTDLVRSGVDLVTVAELLGHASLDSTRIYTLPTDDDLDAAIARLTVDR